MRKHTEEKNDRETKMLNENEHKKKENVKGFYVCVKKTKNRKKTINCHYKQCAIQYAWYQSKVG